MRKRHAMPVATLLMLCILCASAKANDSTSLYNRIYNFPDKVFGTVNSKSQDLQNKLTKHTEKYLTRLARQENKLKKQLWKKDSVAAKELFGDVDARYDELGSKLTTPATGTKLQNVYSGHMDSMTTALNFLDHNKLLKQSPQMQQHLTQIMQSYGALQGKLNGTDKIKKYLQQREQLLKSQLEKFGLTKQFRKFQKDVYYYRAQINEYKRSLEDPRKLEAQVLALVNKIPAFKNFFAKNSQLASLFRLPGSSDPLQGAVASVSGLQTRAMLQQDLQQRFGQIPNVSQISQQHARDQSSPFNQLKQQIEQFPKKIENSEDEPLPNFKPNNQKTKGFLERIEIGTNFQSTKANSFFPVTTDIGLSAGYKLNDRSVVGIGGSYKLGWGRDIRHIDLSHQGIGFRSFVDWKLKGSFYLSGGFEHNYQKPFTNFQSLSTLKTWQNSGLLGVSKIVSIKSKFFGKTKVQVLWDFLSYHQVPRTQAVLFRLGYSLN